MAPTGMASSLVDLRQLNQHYSPVYFDQGSPVRGNRPAMGERVFSLEALNAPPEEQKFAGRR